MALTPPEIEKFKAHLEKFTTQTHCPVCQSNMWNVAGPSSLPALYQSGAMMLGGEVIPLVHLVCDTCYFVRTFAWQPIRPKPTEGGGDV
jgi:hypothetical protein